jgi:cystine transport system permease protein
MLGMSRGQALLRIILPQASRVSVPPLSNTFISLVKDTSLCSTILVTELFREAQQIAAPSGQFLLIYGVAAAVYWVLCTLLAVVQDRLERRLERNAA